MDNLLKILREQKEMKLKGNIYHFTQINFAYNTNHIEGSTLTEEQTRYIYETNTLVLEDMPTCVKTAFKSGFITVAVYDNSSKDYDQVKKDNSHLFINNFYELLQYLR